MTASAAFGGTLQVVQPAARPSPSSPRPSATAAASASGPAPCGTYVSSVGEVLPLLVGRAGGVPNSSTACRGELAELARRRGPRARCRRSGRLARAPTRRGAPGPAAACGGQVAGGAEQHDDVRREDVGTTATRTGRGARIGDRLHRVSGHEGDDPTPRGFPGGRGRWFASAAGAGLQRDVEQWRRCLRATAALHGVHRQVGLPHGVGHPAERRRGGHADAGGCGLLGRGGTVEPVPQQGQHALGLVLGMRDQYGELVTAQPRAHVVAPDVLPDDGGAPP